MTAQQQKAERAALGGKPFDTDGLADYLDVSRRTVIRWRDQRRGPAWVRVNGVIRYLPEDVRAWLEANRHEPVADQRERGAA